MAEFRKLLMLSMFLSDNTDGRDRKGYIVLTLIIRVSYCKFFELLYDNNY